MGTRPDFTKTNVLSDKAMTDAFKQGYNEAQSNRDSTMVFKITVSFEDTKLNERTFENKDLAMKFAIDNLDTPGQKVTIEVLWVPTNYVSEGTVPGLPAGDDEIVDAEVVEEN